MVFRVVFWCGVDSVKRLEEVLWGGYVCVTSHRGDDVRGS